MTIGARVLKTGLAVSVALYICSLLNYSPAIFAAVAAIFTIQPSIYQSWQHIWEQLSTNVLGAVIALAAGMLFGNDPMAVGFVCIIVIILCIKIKMDSTIALTLVTVMAIIEAPGEGWEFALNRFLIILIGMGSAFLVNIVIFPPKHKHHFTTQISSAFNQMSLLLRTVVSNEMKESIFKAEHQALLGTLRRLEEKYSVFEDERIIRQRSKHRHNRQLVLFKHLLGALHRGTDVLGNVEEHYFASAHNDEIDRVFDRHMEELIKFHEYILLKYEGKIKPGSSHHDVEADNEQFMREVLGYYNDQPEDRLRMVAVASSIYEYGFQLKRLDKVVDHYMNRVEE